MYGSFNPWLRFGAQTRSNDSAQYKINEAILRAQLLDGSYMVGQPVVAEESLVVVVERRRAERCADVIKLDHTGVWRNSKHTGTTPGRALYGPGWDGTRRVAPGR